MTLLLGLVLPRAVAQENDRLHDHNFHLWLLYSGDHPISERWELHLEGQWRRHDGGLRPQQSLVRPAVNYRLSPTATVSAGYLYAATQRYGNYPGQIPFSEHRMHQQITIHQKVGRVDLHHRGRNEQRWIEQLSPTASLTDRSWRYQNRFRYMLRMVIPLNRASWYFAASNELFLNYAPTKGARVFDQNRIFAGMGRVIAKDTRLETGYLLQALLQRNARVLELNHTIQIGIFSRLPFR